MNEQNWKYSNCKSLTVFVFFLALFRFVFFCSVFLCGNRFFLYFCRTTRRSNVVRIRDGKKIYVKNWTYEQYYFEDRLFCRSVRVRVDFKTKQSEPRSLPSLLLLLLFGESNIIHQRSTFAERPSKREQQSASLSRKAVTSIAAAAALPPAAAVTSQHGILYTWSGRFARVQITVLTVCGRCRKRVQRRKRAQCICVCTVCVVCGAVCSAIVAAYIFWITLRVSTKMLKQHTPKSMW